MANFNSQTPDVSIKGLHEKNTTLQLQIQKRFEKTIEKFGLQDYFSVQLRLEKTVDDQKMVHIHGENTTSNSKGNASKMVELFSVASPEHDVNSLRSHSRSIILTFNLPKKEEINDEVLSHVEFYSEPPIKEDNTPEMNAIKRAHQRVLNSIPGGDKAERVFQSEYVLIRISDREYIVVDVNGKYVSCGRDALAKSEQTNSAGFYRTLNQLREGKSINVKSLTALADQSFQNGKPLSTAAFEDCIQE